ncbi:unnamed protein product [Penicillium camemberti]|uniref:Str. FM013 n=1 Tax=Penicillium camemberti (strain FM 013) TaxID=1429867 RepID=A0A0G4P6Z0_PENC3|nr:unnamed protein product [Penicillium camemberti]
MEISYLDAGEDRAEVRSNPEDPNTAGQLFLELAEVLLHFDLKSPSIITIQSLAMMAILYVATGSDGKGCVEHAGMHGCLTD